MFWNRHNDFRCLIANDVRIPSFVENIFGYWKICMLTDSKVLQLRLPNFEESLDGVFKIQLGLKRLLWITCMVFLLGLLSFSSALDAAGVEVFDLRCERLDAPLGMDMKSPRLSWKIGSNERDVSQLAYRILVASDPKQLQRDSGDLWDSGKVESGQSVMIPYAGSTLSSLQRCYWKAKVWTANGVSEWSITSQWTMGLLYQNEWEGRWIGFDRAFPWDEVSKFSRLSARYFRQEIELNQQKHVSRATVFLMGLGLYELHLNGKKVGHQVLAPSPTDYTRNIKYNSLDVTELLNSGKMRWELYWEMGDFSRCDRSINPTKSNNSGFRNCYSILWWNTEMAVGKYLRRIIHGKGPQTVLFDQTMSMTEKSTMLEKKCPVGTRSILMKVPG